MPPALAFSTSSTVRSGDRYSVIKNLTFGSSLSSFSLYARAMSVVVTGGVKLGYMSVEKNISLPSHMLPILHPVAPLERHVSSVLPDVNVPNISISLHQQEYMHIRSRRHLHRRRHCPYPRPSLRQKTR